MIKTKLLLVIAILDISCSAFPTENENQLQANNAAVAESATLLDETDYDPTKREVGANIQLDLNIATKEGTPSTKKGTPDDLTPQTGEGIAVGALTDEALSELARCGFGPGFNRPITGPFPGDEGPPPFVIDVDFSSRGNSLNTNNRQAMNLLALLRLMGLERWFPMVRVG